MLSLLHKCTRSGYPSEYLMARIRGRVWENLSQSYSQATYGTTLQSDDTGIWDESVQGHVWLYEQMDGRLREALAPMLFYFELNTLVLCLRNLVVNPSKITGQNLSSSLLAKDIKTIVQSLTSPIEIVEKLERFFGNSQVRMKGMLTTFQEKGIKRLEELIRERFLEEVPSLCTHPEVRSSLRKLIDLRNTMTMSKCLHWQKEGPCRLIEGGHFVLRGADRIPSERVVKRMVRQFTGGRKVSAESLQPVNLAPVLWSRISKSMARNIRSGSPVACCMGYAWHSFEVSQKRSRAFHAERFAGNFFTSEVTV